jgi:hypothetical protein
LPLILLSVTTEQARAFAFALAARRPGLELSAELWRDYSGEPAECFLCAEPVILPCFTQLFADKLPGRVVACPLCPACAALPPLRRAHRGLRLMRKMSGWRGEPGRQTGLPFGGGR